MTGPCPDGCHHMTIAKSPNCDAQRCIKCGKLRLACPSCGGQLRDLPGPGAVEMRCINTKCQKQTNFMGAT